MTNHDEFEEGLRELGMIEQETGQQTAPTPTDHRLDPLVMLTFFGSLALVIALIVGGFFGVRALFAQTNQRISQATVREPGVTQQMLQAVEVEVATLHAQIAQLQAVPAPAITNLYAQAQRLYIWQDQYGQDWAAYVLHLYDIKTGAYVTAKQVDVPCLPLQGNLTATAYDLRWDWNNNRAQTSFTDGTSLSWVL